MLLSAQVLHWAWQLLLVVLLDPWQKCQGQHQRQVSAAEAVALVEAQWQQRLLPAAAARQQGQVLLVPLLLLGPGQESPQASYRALAPGQQCHLLLAAAGGQEAQLQVLGWSPRQRWAS